MYLHLGSNTVIRSNQLIGIFDLEKSSISKWTREFLASSTERQQVMNVSYEMPKSFILCQQGKQKNTVYVSPVATQTLYRRVKRR